MKICLLGDTHLGARNDNSTFHDYFEKFYTNVLFPYLNDNGIKRIVQFGDLFDRRKYINFSTLYKSREYFFDKIARDEIDVDIFVGNHDTYYKNTNEINSPTLLLQDYKNITVYDKPTTINCGGTEIALLPWVCADNYDQSMEFIKNTPAQILFGHLELAGFEMHRGAFNDHGMSHDIFSKFDIVCSGHYHHKSTRGNIHYLGTPYEMSWSDYNDIRGFHIFDTETRELQFIHNPYKMFNKIHYDDSEKNMQDILDIDADSYKSTFVKVVVHNKNNPYWFDLFITKLESAGVVNLQVVEDHLNLNLEDDSDIIDEAEDTLTTLRRVVEGIDTNVSKKTLENFLTILYNEALTLDVE